jgi:hypothetical protein
VNAWHESRGENAINSLEPRQTNRLKWLRTQGQKSMKMLYGVPNLTFWPDDSESLDENLFVDDTEEMQWFDDAFSRQEYGIYVDLARKWYTKGI